MSTNVNLLSKGLKQLGILIFLFIISPIALTVSFKALKKYEETTYYYISYILLSIAILLLIFTIYFAFKTFKTILKALFNN